MHVANGDSWRTARGDMAILAKKSPIPEKWGHSVIYVATRHKQFAVMYQMKLIGGGQGCQIGHIWGKNPVPCWMGKEQLRFGGGGVYYEGKYLLERNRWICGCSWKIKISLQEGKSLCVGGCTSVDNQSEA